MSPTYGAPKSATQTLGGGGWRRMAPTDGPPPAPRPYARVPPPASAAAGVAPQPAGKASPRASAHSALPNNAVFLTVETRSLHSALTSWLAASSDSQRTSSKSSTRPCARPRSDALPAEPPGNACERTGGWGWKRSHGLIRGIRRTRGGSHTRRRSPARMPTSPAAQGRGRSASASTSGWPSSKRPVNIGVQAFSILNFSTRTGVTQVNLSPSRPT